MTQTQPSQSLVALLDLPVEILGSILQFLQLKDLLALAVTCKQLRPVALDTLYRNPAFQAAQLNLLRAGVSLSGDLDLYHDWLTVLADIAQQPTSSIELRMRALMVIMQIEAAAIKQAPQQEQDSSRFDSALKQLLLIGQEDSRLLRILLDELSRRLGMPPSVPLVTLTAEFARGEAASGRDITTISLQLSTGEREKLAQIINELFVSDREQNLKTALHACQGMCPYFTSKQLLATMKRLCQYLRDPELDNTAQQVCGSMWQYLTPEQKAFALRITLDNATQPSSTRQISALQTCREIASQLTPAECMQVSAVIGPLLEAKGTLLSNTALRTGGALLPKLSTQHAELRQRIISLTVDGLQSDDVYTRIAALETSRTIGAEFNAAQRDTLKAATLLALKNPYTQQTAVAVSLLLWPQLNTSEQQEVWDSLQQTTAHRIFAQLHTAVTMGSVAAISLFPPDRTSDRDQGYDRAPPPPPPSFPPPRW
ncbi:MAG: hypothetical protein A3J38_01205 [Gammaproteobacteria bacterium RIFCSPHIGHO2_12_FULL_45_9]|nr:MAG: hypothetical protein A3J38_01205 [Gammaproteobacteria bacterium RIFCSPHIGHO2_12_FULL_45_9]